MTERKSAPFVLIFFGTIFCQFLYTVGLAMVWKDAPDEVVNVQQGSNITLRWHYKMEENETFLDSEFVFNDRKSNVLASRYKGESHYNPISQAIKFVISGKNDVILTLFNAELGSSNSGYCCIVIWDSNKGRRREERCTSIYIYVPPRITHHTPQLSCKQGEQVKLQCNATGYPEPRVKWIHKDTNQTTGNSSVTLVNISGKRSEGNYCCGVKNKFGEDNKCTTVIVKEYGPVKTALSLNRKQYAIRNEVLAIRCKAIAFPPAFLFQMDVNTKQHNSSYGVLHFEVDNDANNVAISCIPWNEYGQGPVEKMILPIYDPPKFAIEMPQWYNMTTGNVTIKCSTTGNPKPTVTWTKGDTGEIVSTKECYKVPYVKCVTKTLVYYCQARNVLGSIKSQGIKVLAMTQGNCSLPYKENKVFDYLPIVIVMNLVISVIFITITLIICWKRRIRLAEEDKRETDESPYQEPIDMVATFEVHLIDRFTLSNEDYATVEEFMIKNTNFRQQRNFVSLNTENIPISADHEEEPTYEKLTVPELL